MRRRVQGLVLGSGAVVLALAAAGACADPTEITVHIATDLPCDALSTSVTGGRDVAVTTQCGAGTRPGIQDVGSIVFVPSGARDTPLTITVVTAHGKDPAACDPKGDPACIVARRKLRYVPHAALDLPIDMRAACLGNPCDPNSTCELGACVPAEKDDPALTAERDAASTYDAAVFGDAGADVTTDAPLDATKGDAGVEGGSGLLECIPGVRVARQGTDVDLTTLEVTPNALLWTVAGAVNILPAGSATPIVLPIEPVNRIAATSRKVYYSPATGPAVRAFDLVTKTLDAVDTIREVVAIHASEGAADNPIYTDGANVYANGRSLFPLGTPPGSAAEITTTANDVLVTVGGSFYDGPRAGNPSPVSPLVVLPASFHDLSTNGTLVTWLEDYAVVRKLGYYQIGGSPNEIELAATHAAVGQFVYDADLQGPLTRESAAYPFSTGGVATPIENGPVVGRIVARADCVYFWARNAVDGTLEIRSVLP